MEFKAIPGIVIFIFCLFYAGEVFADNKLIVVLIDGVRWDYINDPKLKGIPRMIKNGVRAPYVIPVFPSLSYPNYQSIATGLYAENHGFVDNYMYENDTDSFFGMIPHEGATDAQWWNEAEPIWITAEKNNRSAALYWWAGCEVEIMRTHTTICERQRYGPQTEEESLDFLERIDDIVQMFKPSKRFPKDRLSLALMYYGSVDYAGHHSGPKSSELKRTIYDVDDILDKMQSKLKAANLQDEVNIMVVSDHGMTEINDKITKYIKLDRFSSKIKYQIEQGAVSMILPQPGMVDKLYEEMKKENIEGLRVYKKEDIPEMYHLKHNARVLPIYLIAKKGFIINALEDQTKRLEGRPNKIVATHGYDPAEVEDMRAIFIATGPDFRKGVTTEILHAVDLYNVMCSILKLEPLPNNGSFERVKSMLVQYEPPLAMKSSTTVIRNSLYCLFTTLMVAVTSIVINHNF